MRDLEEVLTYEAARSGEATGEATAVLQALPARGGAPRHCGRRRRNGGHVSRIAVAVAFGAALLFDSERQEPAGGGRQPVPDPARTAGHRRLRPASRRRQREPGEPRPRTRRRKATTAWETENYDTPDLGGIKDGVGVYLDTGRPVVARGLRITTPKSGLDVRPLCGGLGPPATLAGWQPVGGGEMTRTSEAFRLNTRGKAKQYYLVWITKLTQGTTGRSNAAISELELSDSGLRVCGRRSAV